MNTPTYDEISALAQSLWRERGCPTDRDTEIWLEAEQQLNRSGATDRFNERAKAETAAESVVEYNISPAVSEQEAIRSAMPKQDARLPPAPPPRARAFRQSRP